MNKWLVLFIIRLTLIRVFYDFTISVLLSEEFVVEKHPNIAKMRNNWYSAVSDSFSDTLFTWDMKLARIHISSDKEPGRKLRGEK